MFERRRRVQNTSDFIQAHRVLRGGETVPALPGLLDQIAACRSEMQRSRRRHEEEALDAEPLALFAEDDDDEVDDYLDA